MFEDLSGFRFLVHQRADDIEIILILNRSGIDALVLHLDKENYKGGSLPNLIEGGAEFEIGKFNTKKK